jgi:FkbM family methyltransferase
MEKTIAFHYAGHFFEYCHRLNDASGLGAYHEIVTRNDYQLDKFINLRGTIVDVGANHGLATIILAKLNPQSQIYAIEPYLPSFEMLKKNITLNHLTNVQCFCMAISDSSDRTMAVYPNDSGKNSLFHSDEDVLETVVAQPWDSFLKENHIQHIHVLKVDAEGAEFGMFRNKDVSYIDVIVGEFHTYSEEEDGETLRRYCQDNIPHTILHHL